MMSLTKTEIKNMCASLQLPLGTKDDMITSLSDIMIGENTDTSLDFLATIDEDGEADDPL